MRKVKNTPIILFIGLHTNDNITLFLARTYMNNIKKFHRGRCTQKLHDPFQQCYTLFKKVTPDSTKR